MSISDIPDEIIDYYKQKARDLPKSSRLTPEDAKLWQELNKAVVEEAYHGGSSERVSELVEQIANSPTNSWRKETIRYYIRKTYYS